MTFQTRLVVECTGILDYLREGCCYHIEGRDPSSLLITLGDATLGLLYPVLCSSVQEGGGVTAESPTKSHKNGQGTGAPLVGGKAGRAGTVQPDKGEAQGNLINVHEYLKGRRKEGRARLFAVLSWHWAPLKHKRFLLSVRKHDFTVTEQWDGLPREIVVSPFLDVFKSHLSMVLLEQGGCTRWPLEFSSSLNHSVTLYTNQRWVR